MVRRHDLVALVLGLFEGGIFVGAWGLGTLGIIVMAAATIALGLGLIIRALAIGRSLPVR
jgi:hypothetical protein